ncbi:maturation protein [ssRNA phage Gerhypos.3_15]|uniref:Maturation protein n=2 Tax=Leviviricetes TaxID=2842243 RepID=A0A8S5L140_9VIRU|nr:maturation protein [ssRNA phage Gerhypos.3_15]DAD51614.1 TPA_asm: maturation protein [ssRNA phage Gerhypos.3_15]
MTLAASEDHLIPPDIERIWYITHKLVRPVLFRYRKNIYDRLRSVKGKPVHDGGGPLTLINIKHLPLGNYIQGQGVYYGRDFRSFGGSREVYAGGFIPSSWPHGYTVLELNNAGREGPLGPDFGSPAQYAAEAYNRFKPKVAQFDAAQGLLQNVIELPGQLHTTAKGLSGAFTALTGRSFRGLSSPSKSVLRSQSRSALKHLLMPKEIGDQFLNEQFGWVPFLSDMKDLYRTYNNQNRFILEILKGNGAWIKKTGRVHSENTIEEVASVDNFSGYVYPPMTDQFYRSSGSFVTSHLYTTLESEVWFDASFKFYAPEFDILGGNRASKGDYGRIMRLIHLYGARVSPTVIWELTPWTWLVDWFSNAGRVFDNVTSTVFDRLVNRWAFVMQRTRKWAVNDSTIHLRSGDVKCSWTQQIVSKRRNEATPYGFGLTSGDLSTRQQLILGALGLTHFT